MALANRDQGLLIGLMAVVLAVAAWFFWLAPTANAIAQANSQLATLDQQKSTIAARLALLTATNTDLANQPEAVKLLQLAIPATGGVPDLLTSIDAMATASGVSLTSIQPSTASDQPTQLALTVNCTGSFTAIQAMVSALEQTIRPLTIQTVSLTSSATAAGSTTITAALSLTTPLATSTTISSPSAAKTVGAK